MEPLKRENLDPACKAIAQVWVGKTCWFDDRPAKIAGRYRAHAMIVTDDGTANVEFSWHAVDRIMRTHKTFRS